MSIPATAVEPKAVGDGAARAAEPGQRAAFWVFVAIATVMVGVYAYLGRHIWFSVGAAGDEWDFLAKRSLNVHDLLTEHGGHLVALPLIVYRTMFHIVGLRTYRPYQFLAIALHIAAAALLRALMRRSGVSPWIATAAAALFVCFGSAGQDILWAFQIAFSGALVFGLVQMLCADHDGGIDRRDWIGLGFGLAALLCSGVAVATIAVVAIATLIRRGWRVAAFHAAPLAVIYVAWSVHYGKSVYTKDKFDIVRWVGRGSWAVFAQLGQIPPVGFLLAGGLVAGLTLAWRRSDPADRRRVAALPVGMIAGALGFLTLTGITRAWAGVQFASSSRYMHVVAALLLVPLAIAANELARHRPPVLALVLLAFVVGIPSNLSKTTDTFPPDGSFEGYRQMIFSVARTPISREVPPDLRPEPNQAPQVTMRWLIQGVDQGWLPKPLPPTPKEIATDTLRLSLEETDFSPSRGCPTLTAPTVKQLAKGESLVVSGRLMVQLLPTADHILSAQLTFGNTFFGPPGFRALTAVVQPVTIRIVPRSPDASAC